MTQTRTGRSSLAQGEFALDEDPIRTTEFWLADALPVPRRALYCWSLDTAVYAVAFCGLITPFLGGYTADLGFANASSRLRADWATLLVQAATAIYVSFLASVFFSRKRGDASLPKKVCSGALVIGILMALEVFFESVMLKPIFALDRPSIDGSSSITNWIGSFVGIGHDRGTGAPSGFAMRQAMLLLFGWLLSEQKEWQTDGARLFLARSVIRPLLGVSLVLVLILRVLGGMHRPFDVALGAAFGEFLLWWAIILSRLVFFGSDVDVRYGLRLAYPGIFFSLVAFYFCRDPRMLTVFICTWSIPWAMAYQWRAAQQTDQAMHSKPSSFE